MEEAFEGLEGIRILVDDILVYGKNREEQYQRLSTVLRRAREKGIRFNSEKCEFSKDKVKYFGHIISRDRIKPDPEKIRAIQDMLSPQSKEELQTLLGMLNFLSKYIPDLSSKNKPLRDLTKATDFRWETDHEAKNLAFFDHKCKVVELKVDASKHGLGAELSSNGKIVGFASRALSTTVQNYSQLEKELYVIVFGCKHFHHYIYGRKTIVTTDHRPLETILSRPLNTAPAQLQRIMIQIQPYNIKVHYSPGSDIPVPDALSRLHLPDVDTKMQNDIEVFVHTVMKSLPVSDSKLDEIRRETEKDTQLKAVKELILKGWPAKEEVRIQPTTQDESNDISQPILTESPQPIRTDIKTSPRNVPLPREEGEPSNPPLVPPTIVPTPENAAPDCPATGTKSPTATSKVMPHTRSGRVIWKLNNFEGYLDIFTDGSKNEGMVGAAFGVPKMNVSKQFKLHSKASVFQAEAAALAEVLEFSLTEVQKNYSGHCGTNDYRARFNGEDGTCISCSEDETVGHMLLDPEQYREKRENVHNFFRERSDPVSLFSFLGKLNKLNDNLEIVKIEHDVVRETFASNITDGTVILNLKKLDGTLITHIQNFFDEVQIIKMTVLGSEYVGEDSDVSYSVCFAFKLPVKKPNEIDEETYEYVGPEAMVKLRQKNPSVIRVAEEDKGVFHAVFNSAIDITKSSIISQSVYHNCRGSGEVVYLTEDVKDVPSLKEVAQLKPLVQNVEIVMISVKNQISVVVEENIALKSHMDKMLLTLTKLEAKENGKYLVMWNVKIQDEIKAHELLSKVVTEGLNLPAPSPA
ncbi:hypothetical protein QYM36_015351, partial [Artemia franciscana]